MLCFSYNAVDVMTDSYHASIIKRYELKALVTNKQPAPFLSKSLPCRCVSPAGRLTIELVQCAPPWHHAAVSGGEDMRRGGQADGLDVRAEGERGLQLQHTNIVVGGHGVVVRRHNKRLDVNCFGLGLLAAYQRGPHQGRPLFGVIVPIKRKERDNKTLKYTFESLTIWSSAKKWANKIVPWFFSPMLDSWQIWKSQWPEDDDCCLPLKAVCCADQPAFIDDRGSTGVAPVEPQTDLPWQLPFPSILATHYPTPHSRTCATSWGEKKDDVVKMEMKRWWFSSQASQLRCDLLVPECSARTRFAFHWQQLQRKGE